MLVVKTFCEKGKKYFGSPCLGFVEIRDNENRRKNFRVSTLYSELFNVWMTVVRDNFLKVVEITTAASDEEALKNQEDMVEKYLEKL
jgi:hypothetical protein